MSSTVSHSASEISVLPFLPNFNFYPERGTAHNQNEGGFCSTGIGIDIQEVLFSQHFCGQENF